MQGLANPLDILDAHRTNHRINARSTAIARLGGKTPTGFEDVLLSKDIDLLRGERSLMKAMDYQPNEDDRRLGKTRSPFDALISAQVAAAVGSVYEGVNFLEPGALAILGSPEIFSPAATIRRVGPGASNITGSTRKIPGDDKTQEAMEGILSGIVRDSVLPLSGGGGRSPDTFHPMLARALGFFERNSSKRRFS